MPLGDRSRHEDDRPDERFEAFIERRRTEEAQRRQQRNLLIVVAGLAVACVALAAANVVLALRLSAGGPATLSAAPQASPPASDVVAASRETPRRAEPSAPGPGRGEPAAEMPGPRAPGAGAPPAPAGGEGRPPAVERPRETGEPARPERAGRPVRPPASAADPAERTALWMIDTYGRSEAEARAQAAARFYTPEDPGGVYWSQVLAHIRAAGPR